MMNENLTIEQVPELKSRTSNLADKPNFVGQKLQHSLIWQFATKSAQQTLHLPKDFSDLLLSLSTTMWSPFQSCCPDSFLFHGET